MLPLANHAAGTGTSLTVGLQLGFVTNRGDRETSRSAALVMTRRSEAANTDAAALSTRQIFRRSSVEVDPDGKSHSAWNAFAAGAESSQAIGRLGYIHLESGSELPGAGMSHQPDVPKKAGMAGAAVAGGATPTGVTTTSSPRTAVMIFRPIRPIVPSPRPVPTAPPRVAPGRPRAGPS